MADPLYELLIPYFDSQDAAKDRPHPLANDPNTSSYLSRLTGLPLSSLTSAEPQALSQNSQSIVRSLQALSKRSHKSIISAADNLGSLRETLPEVAHTVHNLQNELPGLEKEAQSFSDKYSRAAENPILDRRRKAMLLARNADRVSDVLDLPTLLASAIASSSTTQAPGNSTTSSAAINYASALDLHAYIKRLQALYPDLAIIEAISAQAEQEMKGMTTNLIASLQSQGLKLASAMRTIGWLRRVAPELDEPWVANPSAALGNTEGALGALFLVCRLNNLVTTLNALEPLRELADQESKKRSADKGRDVKGAAGSGWSGGQQTERYLKRYLEIFREQSFAIISMYKSIFPAALPQPLLSGSDEIQMDLKTTQSKEDQSLHPLPSALATFAPHLIDILFETLKVYLPNVQDQASRDSLLTQVLYCAGSLGRLGGDFSMMLALLEEESTENDDDTISEEEEWVEVMKKHRIQASRLELLASGVGTGRTTSSSTKIAASAA